MPASRVGVMAPELVAGGAVGAGVAVGLGLGVAVAVGLGVGVAVGALAPVALQVKPVVTAAPW